MRKDICEFCGIQLHYNDDGTGWKENEKPNCPGNPSGPEYGHFIGSRNLESE